MNTKTLSTLTLIFLSLVWIVDCQGSQATPVPTLNTSQTSPTTVSVLPTPTLAAPVSNTLPPPPPVVVPTNPTATVADIVPTAPPAVATPTEPAEVIISAVPADSIGPDFPPNINPLTGETVDPAILNRRPLLIKVSNSSALVRPQSGLSQADLVYEHISEGGITRFTAMFYGHDAELVGPIRSGRLIDLQLPLWYDAAFAYSGASNEVKWMFRNGGFFERVVTPDWGHGGFWRDYTIGNPDKPGWETLYTNTESIREQISERGEDVSPTLERNLIFTAEPPAGGQPIRTMDIRYPATNVFWQYNAGTGRYLRWVDGAIHTDANNGQQLSANNVVILYADHVTTDIVEDSNGSLSIDIQFWGEGKMTFFRNGQRFDGVWRREVMNGMLVYYDNAGNRLPFHVGNTWFQVVPADFTNVILGQ